MPRTKQSKPKYNPQSLLDRTEIVETELGAMRFYASDIQRGEESLDEDTNGHSALALMLGGLDAGDTVYDVGCRSGLHSVAFAKAVGPSGKVMCFEHDLHQLFLAHMNVTDHGLDSCVSFLPIVASDQFSLRRYNRFDLDDNQFDPGNGIDDLSGSGQCIAMPLDQLSEHKSPHLIRIGPMGLELAALKGMQRLILDAKPRLFVAPESPKSHDEIALYLSQIGYDVYGFSPRYKNKKTTKRIAEGQYLDPQDFSLYCVLPRFHRAPAKLPLLMKAQDTNFRSQLTLAEGHESFTPYFEVDIEAENTKGVANAHFAYWAWQSLRNELRTFVRTFLQSALGQLSPETYGELTRQAVEFISSETPAREYESLRGLLFQAMKSIRRAVEQGQSQKEEIGTLEEKLGLQASELSKLSYQLTQATMDRSNADLELEAARLEKESLFAQTSQLQQSISELTAKLISAKESEAKSLEVLATSNARGAGELMSITKAHKQEISQLEQSLAKLEQEKASLLEKLEQVPETVAQLGLARQHADENAARLAVSLEEKSREIAAAQNMAQDQAQQIEALKLQLSAAQDQEARLQLTIANSEAQSAQALGQVDELKRQLSAAQEQETMLLQTISNTKAQGAEVLTQVSELKLQLSAAQEQEALLRRNVESAEAHGDKLRTEIEELTHQLKAAQEHVSTLTQKVDMAEADRDELKGQIAKLNEENAAIQSRCSDQANQIEELSDALAHQSERGNQQIEKLSLELKSALEKEPVLRAQLSELETQKKSLKDQVAGLEAEKEVLQSASSEQANRLSELSTELSNERAKSSDYEARLAQTQQDLHQAVGQNQALSDELDALKANANEMRATTQMEIKSLEDQLAQRVPVAQYQALAASNQELQNLVAALNAELEARDVMVSDLTDLVRLQSTQLERRSN